MAANALLRGQHHPPALGVQNQIAHLDAHDQQVLQSLCRVMVLSLDVPVLGRIRLSRATDESTSPERQREVMDSWAKSNDHEVVGWAEDLDVSG